MQRGWKHPYTVYFCPAVGRECSFESNLISLFIPCNSQISLQLWNKARKEKNYQGSRRHSLISSCPPKLQSMGSPFGHAGNSPVAVHLQQCIMYHYIVLFTPSTNSLFILEHVSICAEASCIASINVIIHYISRITMDSIFAYKFVLSATWDPALSAAKCSHCFGFVASFAFALWGGYNLNNFRIHVMFIDFIQIYLQIMFHIILPLVCLLFLTFLGLQLITSNIVNGHIILPLSLHKHLSISPFGHKSITPLNMCSLISTSMYGASLQKQKPAKVC